MIWFDGEKWNTYRYKYRETIIGYTDNQDGFAEGTVFEENILSEEQQERLNDIKGINLNYDEAIAYINGEIELPDTRSNEQKLLDLVLELDPTQANNPDMEQYALTWYPGIKMERFSYVFYNGKLYKALHPIRDTDIDPPDISVLYMVIGQKNEETGLEEITPSSEHLYPKDFIGQYDGRVYKSNYNNNGNSPYHGSKFPDWWEDLGTIEEYDPKKGE